MSQLTSVHPDSPVGDGIGQSKEYWGAADQYNRIWAWYNTLTSLKYSEIPSRKCIVLTDMINAFAEPSGSLYHPRIGALVEPISALVDHALAQGCKNFLSIQDEHSPNAFEFQSYPPHAVGGSVDSELIAELSDVNWLAFRKNTLNVGATGAGFDSRIFDMTEKRQPTVANGRPDVQYDVQSFIVVGNCTDLCVLATAQYLQDIRNQWNRNFRVYVPASMVDTFDIPDRHNADFWHRVALFQLQQNGVRVMKDIVLE